MTTFRTADLFSGIGGIRLGFEQACQEAGVEHSCVFASDINKDSVKVYRDHFGNSPDPLFNIKSSEGREDMIPDFDVMLSGFPCQSFASCGKRLGFKDETRGTLFFNVASIIAAKQPQAFLLENVKGLTTHNQGRTFNTIKKTLEIELGYHVSYQILNSKDFGVPHNRPRIYIIGFKDHNVGKGFQFPQPTDDKKRLKHILETDEVDPKFYISQQYLDTLKAHRARHEQKKSGFGYVVRSKDDIASCLVLGGMGLERNLIYDPRLKEPTHIKGRKTMTNSDMVRKLTHRECERLQGFPEDFQEYTIDVCLDHQKNCVDAAGLNLKSLLCAGNAEKTESKESVLFAGKSIYIKGQEEYKHALKTVHIYCEEKGVEIRNLKRNQSYAHGAEDFSVYLPVESEEGGSFVQEIVSISGILEKTIPYGKEEYLPREPLSIRLKNGKRQLSLYGDGITQLVRDAMSDSIIKEKLTKSITLSPSNSKTLELELITSFFCAIRVISGLIPTRTFLENSFRIEIHINPRGWTAGISDTARWEALANSVTVPVIKAIAAAMMKEMMQPSGFKGDSLLMTDEEEFVDSGSLSGDVNEKENQEGDPGGQPFG